MFELDHIVVSAETLGAGVDWVERHLAVSLAPGGAHPVMGTHNRLLGLEDGLYFEVIAINPDAPAPARPRWFGLDDFQGAPRLTNWVCRTDELDHVLQRLGPGLGQPVALSRGDLSWRMAVPADGQLPFDQTYPALIEWQRSAHPANRLPPSGCRLDKLLITHPDAMKISDALSPMIRDARLEFRTGPTGIEATFTTPAGTRVLR